MARVAGSALARLAQACAAGDHTPGTRSRHCREHGENTTAMLPSSSCCCWDPRGSQLTLSLQSGAFPAFLQQLPALPVPGGSWGRNNSAEPSSDSLTGITSVIQPGLDPRDVLSTMWGGTWEVCATPGASSRGSSNEQPS